MDESKLGDLDTNGKRRLSIVRPPLATGSRHTPPVVSETAQMNVTTQSSWLKRLPPWLYKLGAQAWIDRTYPRHLFLETTAACNLACTYCPREARQTHMEWDLFCRLVDEANLYGGRSFSLHLFGEPTLYPKWTQAITYLKSAPVRHTVLLTTNGTTLNARVDDLLHANPDLVLWTWRPEATFTPETKSKLRRWGKFRVRFIQEITPKEAYQEWADWPNLESRALHNYGGTIDVGSFGGLPSPSQASARWPCYHLWLAPAVAWNGDILMCCADPHHKEVLGHFPEQSVAEVWQGERLKQIRDSHLTGKFSGICQTCDVWKQYPDLFFNWQKHAPSR